MKTKNCILSLLIMLSMPAWVKAQRFDSLLTRLNENYKQEKIYVHTDRQVYSPGETIWFKAYLFTGNYPSLISKTLYTELLDEKGKVLARRSAPVLSSSAAGSFDLPATLNQPTLYLRAYTRWMLNFDSSFIYTKAIVIAAPVKANAKSLPPAPVQKNSNATASPQYFLQFFPEGGDLVQGIESRIAFKATDRLGKPAAVAGEIMDNNGKKVISFAGMHDGMGFFPLLPGSGTYIAKWKDGNGQLHETPLPAAKSNGVTLEVEVNPSNIEFKIRRPAGSAPPYPTVYVVAHMNQQLLYRARANLEKNPLATSTIPTENFPAGIIQVTLFSPDEKPLAERIVFVNQFNHTFITDVNIALKDLNKKKKNVIQLDVPDTIPCNLSISVTDADLNNGAFNENIFSSLFLTSDVRGYVHNPSYYFSSEADSLIDHLDLVMMTNGWRRFRWDNVLAGRWPTLTYAPDNYLSIQGQVHGLSRNLLYNRSLNAIIEVKKKQRDFMSTAVDPNGKFVFPDMVFYDTAKLYYQFNDDKKKDLTSRATFEIRNMLMNTPLLLRPDSSLQPGLPVIDAVTLAKNTEINREQLSAEELLKVKTMKEVVVTTKAKTKQQKMDEEYTSGFFSGGESRSFIPEDDPAFVSSVSVLDYLQSRVAGLKIQTTGEPSVTWRGSVTALFENEMEMDIGSIQTIPMSDVAMIKVFPPPFFGASGAGAGGAIAVYLKKGASRGTTLSRGLESTSLEGYSPVKEFYSPDYSRQDQPDTADYRKTLYWNPFVGTDKNHRRIYLTFYNNDYTKRMRIIVEGCNEDGKLTRTEKIIQ